MLAWTVYISFAGVLALMLLPAGRPRAARKLALATALAGWRFSNDCSKRLGPQIGNQFFPGSGWHQPRAGFADGHCVGGGHFIFMEHRASRQGILRLLPGIDWRGVRCVSQLRFVPAVCVLRAGHHSQIFSHRDLGLDESRIRRDETGALLVRGQRHGARGNRRGVCRVRREKHEPPRTREISLPGIISILGVPAGVHRFCDSRGHLAVSHLGADRPRGRADGGFDAARRCGDETRCVRGVAGGDDALPAGIARVAR